ncbi:MAG: hypothetical protein J0H08_08260 [Rhizobiales bacterium]|jgi:hypothetical protein|nr:hypothetical protein [Hyphomicrobiales bacterium]
MKRIPADGVFKPAMTRIESRQDATTRAALAIIASESAAVDAKTDRLRAARLAHEAQNPEPPKTPKRRRAG